MVVQLPTREGTNGFYAPEWETLADELDKCEMVTGFDGPEINGALAVFIHRSWSGDEFIMTTVIAAVMRAILRTYPKEANEPAGSESSD